MLEGKFPGKFYASFFAIQAKAIKHDKPKCDQFMFFLQVLEPVSVDYDQVFGDMQSAAGDEGGDQKAIQLAGAASSVLNAKAGQGGNDSAAAGERAAVRTSR